MDSITQAALGALCGEIVLGRQLGYKGALWGALFGTLPDLDIIAYPWLNSAEQLMWHRGLSHSVLAMFVSAFLFGPVIRMLHNRRKLSYIRCMFFVFLAWITHVLIDCFNTYGTQIMEPFNSNKYGIDNISIIDFFFLVPLLLGLLFSVFIFRKRRELRTHIGYLTMLWLSFYFVASLYMKRKAIDEFTTVLSEQGIYADDFRTSPTFSNIFLWRMVAKDDENYYVAYWSLLDDDKRKVVVRKFSHGHALEKRFEDSEDLQAIRWFCRGWHKTYTMPNEPDSIYIAAVHMSEVRVPLTLSKYELRPSFIWKITKTASGFELDRPFKMSKDGYSMLVDAVKLTYQRARGGVPGWMEGTWCWDLKPEIHEENEESKE